MQVGQTDMEAMHANAAGLMGQMAAAIAVLDMASGAGSLGESGQIKITADHVTVSRLQKTFLGSNSRSAQHVAVFTRSLVKMAFPIFHQVASRLVEICLQARTIFRLPLDEDVTGPEAGQDVGDVPVKGTYPLAAFAQPVPTQPPPRATEDQLQRVEEEQVLPGDVPIAGCQVRQPGDLLPFHSSKLSSFTVLWS